jgi:hypothetical protein
MVTADRGGFRISSADQGETNMIGIFGGWALGALIAFLWGGYPGDLCLGMAAALSNICMWAISSNRVFLAFANVAGISLGFRYVLMAIMFGVYGQDADPVIVRLMAFAHRLSSEWIVGGIALLALFGGAIFAQRYVHGDLPAEHN